MKELTQIVFTYGVFLIFLLSCGHSSPVVKTNSGDLKGFSANVLDKPVDIFLGIPYASPPVGKRRFRKSLPVEPWQEIREAIEIPYSCVQQASSFEHAGFGDFNKRSEDCLYLNIWTPSFNSSCYNCSLKPVLVWIHGGAFIMGSASHSFYNGSILAAYGDVVVAAMNYRLGVFGFLTAGTDQTPGNMGLLDQNLALRWIKENIQFFGGDPDSITLFGESAGAVSVNMHLLSPLSRGLFKRAILESGFLYSSSFIDNHEHAILISNQYAEIAGCADDELDDDLLSNPDKVLECLRSKSADELLNAQMDFSRVSIIAMKPTYENQFLPKNHILSIERGQFFNTDILVGTNNDEGSLFLSLGLPHKYSHRRPQNVSREETISVARLVFDAFNTPVPGDALDTYFGDVGVEDYVTIRHRLVSMIGDRIFVCPGVHFAGRYARRGNKVYYYNFEHRTRKGIWGEWMGVPHTDEIQYVFGMPLREPDQYTDEDVEFCMTVMNAWVTFARTGTPNINATTWPIFTEENPSYLNLNPRNYSRGYGLRNEQCKFWKRHLKYPPYFGGRLAHGKGDGDSGSVFSIFNRFVGTLGKWWLKLKSYGNFLS